MLPQVRVQDDPSVLCLTGRNISRRRQDTGHKVQLYGWDNGYQSWYGPNELYLPESGTQRLLDAMRKAPGRSWYGPVREKSGRFFAVVHQLKDCAVAMLYCDESKAGPAEIVTVIPAKHRSRLREEFAFEFVAFTGFLGCLGAGADMAVHDRITAALAETGDSDSLVFSISTGLWTNDQDDVLSRCVEKVAAAMLRWVEE